MAIKEIRREWSACQLGYVCEFMLHTEADVKDLPICCVGSVAHVSETNTDYVCTGKRWVPREAKTVVILPETAVPIVGDENPVTEQFTASLVEGDKYTFTYNSAAYECVAQPFDLDGVACTALGNLGAITGGKDTGEPFVFMELPPAVAAELGAAAMLVPLDGAESVTISITAKTELVNESENAGSAGGGAGTGGGVFYIANTTSIVQPAYADAALTTVLSYEQGKEIMQRPYVVFTTVDGMLGVMMPPLAGFFDDAKTATIVLQSNGGMMPIQLTFSDTP